MRKYVVCYKFFFILVIAGISIASAAHAAGEYRVSGPHAHENLSIFFVHGASESGPVPITLQEAMAKGAVIVHETGNVSNLSIENTSDSEVFIQSGDIVKGGKQDRVLTLSLLLSPKSGRVPISSFCVESGRWTARGKEDAKRFASSLFAAPSRELKLAMKAPVVTSASELEQPGDLSNSNREGRIVGTTARVSGVLDRQQVVWDKVKKTQEKLSRNIGENVASTVSTSSLQLALENRKLLKIKSDYLDALKKKEQVADDIIGIVIAINGKLNSADIYSSNGLFRKMWPKLLQTSVTEAIAERGGKASKNGPLLSDVNAFLDKNKKAKVTNKELSPFVKLETSDRGHAYYFATKRSSGSILHLNYLMK